MAPDPAVPAAAAAGAAKETTKDANPSGIAYLELVAECYKGTDPGTGEFLNLITGDVAAVSAANASRLMKDFPGEFKRSDEKAFNAAQADRSKRAKALAEKVAAREKRALIAGKAAAIDEDDEDEVEK